MQLEPKSRMSPKIVHLVRNGELAKSKSFCCLQTKGVFKIVPKVHQNRGLLDKIKFKRRTIPKRLDLDYKCFHFRTLANH